MVAAKSLAAGVLVVAMIAATGGATFGGSIVAGGRGTLLIGGSSYAAPAADSAPAATTSGSYYAPLVTPSAGYTPAPLPATPPAVAPAAWSPGLMSWSSNGVPITTTIAAGTSQVGGLALNLPQAVTAAPATSYDAFVNLGAGPYAESTLLTTGNAQPWYNSAKVGNFFGGQQPTLGQQQAFDSTILQRVQQTFALSGVNVRLTDDPTASAPHSLSLVSQSNSTVGDVLGATHDGHNGFSFFDNAANSAQSLDQLEWIVAHNIAHELMLSFGVGEKYDATGNYIDARNANWSMMVDPNATFSAAAAKALLTSSSLVSIAPTNTGAFTSPSLQILGSNDTRAVPEPATIALWGGLAGVFGLARKRSRRAA